MDLLTQFLQQVGEYFSNESVARGAVVTGGTVLAVLAAGWRFFRPKRSERIKYTLDAPAGTKANIRIGSEDE